MSVLAAVPYMIQIRMTLPFWPCIDRKLKSFLDLTIHVASQ